MKNLILSIFLAFFLLGCADPGIPESKTMETGEVVRTPPQYEEFCQRDTDNLCPEEE